MGKNNGSICGLDMGEGGREAEKCREPKHGGPSGRCIFHAPLDEKDTGEFWTRLREYIAGKEASYFRDKKAGRRAIFIDCRKFVFPENDWAEFKRVFEPAVWFDGATFKGPTLFNMTRFKGGVNFRNTVFENRVAFSVLKAITAQFRRAIFLGEVVFEACGFAVTADFSDTHFEKGGIFINTDFGYKGLFTGKTNFNNAVFEKTAEILHSRFNTVAEFENTIFKEGASFYGSKFLKEANFKGTVFSGFITGLGTGYLDSMEEARKLMGEAYNFLLEEERISGDFTQVRFEEGAVFKKAEAEFGIDFLATQWDGQASFYEIRFFNARFLMCRFGKGFGFLCSVMGNRALFWRCVLEEVGRFYTVGKSLTINEKGVYKVSEPVRLDLISLVFENDPGIEFRNLDLSLTAFAYTRKLENVIFENVTWSLGTVGSRKNVWDEIYAEENKISYEAAAKVYGDIRRNYESILAFETASDFHIGQMEMLLLNPSTSKPKKFFLWWYKWISNFGESVGRPLIWFGGLWLLFALVWFFKGFPDNGGSLNYDLSWTWPISPWVETAKDVGRSLLYSFKTFLTLPDLKGGIVSQTIGAVQRLAGASVITLFILALRRAFRR